ncbi:SAM-dependent methyltransferase [Mesorhizobium retamae]|uniref:Methyltransferase domain-containing protein n=1 Tax=Mesorhizobium retamae TaxID=2912854 RepID=A0ABS9QPF3_9HYPH|nr:class I SAM-dependent methyltransferase [Mesorhizobium sp. IRAMC:0171]MCG7508439.1 methyltransferase domain-containing protein [Mesorhizobium sp. IRAMC:0171]
MSQSALDHSRQTISHPHGQTEAKPYRVIRGVDLDGYEEKVVYTYQDNPEDWRKAIGEDLMFQFGVYDDPRSTPPISLDESGLRYFDRQLFIAGLDTSNRRPIRRILDIGCGWGYILKHLADRFPECPRLDGINVSRAQLEYCAAFHAKQGLSERIQLFLCNAQDVDLLPDPQVPYDLVVIRGVISHFPNELYERTMRKLFTRVRPGGQVVISDNLYNQPPESYESDTHDDVDRLACRHRKSPAYFRRVLEEAGFVVQDMRVLPSNVDVVRWLMESRANIERHFTAADIPPPLEELRVLAENWSVALIKNKVSTYSVVVTRAA